MCPTFQQVNIFLFDSVIARILHTHKVTSLSPSATFDWIANANKKKILSHGPWVPMREKL